MRIAVVRAGGTGGYFGGRLALAGHDVVFVARGAHLAALREGGLSVESINGDFTVRPVEATDDPGSAGTVDAVLMTVKAWQLEDAARAASPLLGPSTPVVPLLNGVEAHERLAVLLSTEHAAAGLCTIYSGIVAPGRIRHVAIDPTVWLGRPDNRPDPRLERLRSAIESAGVRAVIPQDILLELWKKLFLITPWYVGTVARVPVGAWREVPECRALAEALLLEVAAVAAACGVSLPEDGVEKTFGYYDGLAPDGTSSFQRDVLAGRPSELDAQPGVIVRKGRRYGVPTPAHEFVYAALLPGERAARRA